MAHGRAAAIVRWRRAKISATGNGAAGCVVWAAGPEATGAAAEGRAPGSPRYQAAIFVSAVCRRSRIAATGSMRGDAGPSVSGDCVVVVEVGIVAVSDGGLTITSPGRRGRKAVVAMGAGVVVARGLVLGAVVVGTAARRRSPPAATWRAALTAAASASSARSRAAMRARKES